MHCKVMIFFSKLEFWFSALIEKDDTFIRLVDHLKLPSFWSELSMMTTTAPSSRTGLRGRLDSSKNSRDDQAVLSAENFWSQPLI